MKALKRPLTGRRRTVAAVLAATALIGGAGAATAVAVTDGGDHDGSHATAGTRHEDRDDHDREGVHDDSDDDGKLAAGTKIEFRQAVDAARKSVAGTVTSVDLEGEQGKADWKVEVVTDQGVEHEVTVNGADGKVTDSKVDQDDDRDGDLALVRSARTDIGRAVDAALGKVAGTVTSAESDEDHGRTAAWQVDVTDAKGAEHEVTVDAASGRVTATHTDHDDD